MHFFQQISTKMLTSLLKNTIMEMYDIKINKNKRPHIADNYLQLLMIKYYVNNLHLN